MFHQQGNNEGAEMTYQMTVKHYGAAGTERQTYRRLGAGDVENLRDAVRVNAIPGDTYEISVKAEK